MTSKVHSKSDSDTKSGEPDAQEFENLGEKTPEWCSPLFEKDLPPKRTKKRAEML